MELLSASRGFLKCNFHCHTTCSDGRLSPKDVMAAYRALDYDVLAITDHREVTRPAADEIPAGLMLIPGTELDFLLPTQAVHLLGLGVSPDFHETMMRDMDPRLKVKVLLAQALFGSPDIILLDEPTNNLDLASVVWLEDFLMDYEGTVLVVSHDRYFLNNVCTHIVDIDYGKIKMYVGNYDFWYESSQLMQKLIKDQNKKAEQKIAELQSFISRFAANKSKSRQATSRRKLLDKLTVEEMPASGRRYPWVGFKADREPGKDRLFVTEVSKTVDGVKLLNLSLIHI